MKVREAVEHVEKYLEECELNSFEVYMAECVKNERIIVSVAELINGVYTNYLDLYVYGDRIENEEGDIEKVFITSHIYGTYAPDSDNTFIMRETVNEKGVPTKTELLGFVHGNVEDDKKELEAYIGKYIYTY